MNIVEQVDHWVKIQHALVSVSNKSGLDVLVTGLVELNPEIHLYSTGGTFEAISRILGPQGTARHVSRVADYTGQPETQGGLVKTLDFKIYLGLLTETHNASHQADLERTGAVPLDLVVVNLYPFEATVARKGTTVETARANIDIGGPCMIRAAAKNYLRVAAIVDPQDYPELLASLRAGRGGLDLITRFELAQKAFAHTAAYERAIYEYLGQQEPGELTSVYTLD